ncbi:MAG: linear amide C-N hydrolase [Candidatus Latescibacterota bacterium]|nr:MAG: linear amide C-N hydrolase [Candidatus Latescibacterota bacterium]
MKRIHWILCTVIATAGVAFFVPPDLEACSVFSLSTGDGTVMGQNLDFDYFPGYVVVNLRGVKKTILPWKGHWPDPSNRETVSWVSRYGSVTFTCYGRDFIEGGMNEAGLLVDEANLAAVYPPDDGRPGVSCPQWMQYQLDNFATVEEVIEHLDDLRPDGEGWHYLIADRSGACAVIEYQKGEAVVYTGDAVEVCAITNTTHRQALSHIPMDKAFGGDVDIAAGNDSYGRFVRMAAMMRDYEPESDGDAVTQAFRMLDAVRVENTIRSVVYDAVSARVLWKTPDNPSVKWLSFDKLDFSKNSQTKMIDVETNHAGEVSEFLVNYTPAANRTLVDAVLGPDAENHDIIRKLKARELTFEQALDLIADQPWVGAR